MKQEPRSFAEVKDMLLDRLESLVEHLLPDGYLAGGKRYWMARNPSRADRDAGSMWVWLTGERAGGWCDAASDQKGDVFQLIQLVEGGTALQAKWWAERWLGLTGQRPVPRPAPPKPDKPPVDHAEELARNRRRAHAIWLDGAPLALKGGVRNPAAALAFRYLEETRGLDLSRLPRLPGAIRLLSDQHHQESGIRCPALGTVVLDAAQGFLALHRIFITDQGEKLPAKPARKVWPSFAGGWLPIWDAGTGISALKQAARGELTPAIACEGVEDGLAAAIGNPDHRVRGAITLGNLRHMPIFACDDRLTVWRDNDWGNDQAEAQLRRAVQELAERGRATGTAVYLAASYLGKDANDLMKGEAT